MLYYEKGWFAERSRIYKELSERENLFKKLDSTFFYFNSPDAGWIDMEIYLNGKKCLTCGCSNVYDPFSDMKRWLEDIVRSNNIETTMRIDCEGAEVYLHYEKLSDAEETVVKTSVRRHYDANNDPEIGLFFVYDSCSDRIPCYAVCETKDFVNSIYLALLALCGDCYNSQYSNFAKEWYYDKNYFKKNHKFNNKTFYNLIKSPLIEWNIRSPRRYCEDVHFRKMPNIKETISMWCDYGDALFWGRGLDGHSGGCYGDADSFSTYTAGEISLDSIQGLREWYNEWDSSPIPDTWTKKQWKDWYERGYEFAKQIRKLLPDTIDLYYDFWYPKKEVVRKEFREYYPMIVFNENHLVNNKRGGN